MGSAIQFYGSNSVLDAAKNRQCPGWAIFNGSQFLFKYEGSDQQESLQHLDQILSVLENSGSGAMYTIKFYEKEGKAAVKIKANTPYDGSFNFRLIDESEVTLRKTVYNGHSKEVLEKLESIEARISAIESDDDEEEEEGGAMGIITGLLKEPEKLQALFALGKSLFGIGPKPVSLAGIPAASGNDEVLQAAIETLKKNDPKITEHLQKLAAMSETQKPTFDYLLSMLDKL